MSYQTPTNRQNPMTNKQSLEELEEELISSADNFASEEWMERKLKAYKQAIREEMLEQVDEFKSQIQFMSDDIGFHSETSRKLCDRIKQQLKQE